MPIEFQREPQSNERRIRLFDLTWAQIDALVRVSGVDMGAIVPYVDLYLPTGRA